MNAARDSVDRLADAGALTTREVHTTQDFEALLSTAGDRPVIVLFKADWCRVCTMLRGQIAPVLNAIQRPCAVALIDVDRLPSLARRFDVRHLPTLIVLDRGATIACCVGQRPMAVMRHLLSTVLSGLPDADDTLSSQPKT